MTELEQEELETVMCVKRNKKVAVIRILWYYDNLVDVVIEHNNNITEIDTITITTYNKIRNICKKYGLGKEKRY